ncbi:MAG: thioredoxin domain-containing protein [Fibrobacter sp.]|nr:thioredoxin domain-containing protein [Fibrobacter sp.]
MKLLYSVSLILSIITGFVFGGLVFKKSRTDTYLFSRVLASHKSDNCFSEGVSGTPVTLIEYSDIECPYSSKNQHVIKRLLEKYKNRIKYHYRNFPLSFHKNAVVLAKAVNAANVQGKGKEMRDILFAMNSYGDVKESVHGVAQGIDIDYEKFCEYMSSPEADEDLRTEITDGKMNGVRSTPTVFINGYLIKGVVGFDVYSIVIEKLLSRARS